MYQGHGKGQGLQHVYVCVCSNGSDTANCLATLASVVHSQWGLVGGMVTTVHAYTPTLKIVDGPNTRNWRDGRAAANNVIPVPSTAAAAVATIIPGLGGYLIIVICIIIDVLWSDLLYMYDSAYVVGNWWGLGSECPLPVCQCWTLPALSVNLWVHVH